MDGYGGWQGQQWDPQQQQQWQQWQQQQWQQQQQMYGGYGKGGYGQAQQGWGGQQWDPQQQQQWAAQQQQWGAQPQQAQQFAAPQGQQQFTQPDTGYGGQGGYGGAAPKAKAKAKAKNEPLTMEEYERQKKEKAAAAAKAREAKAKAAAAAPPAKEPIKPEPVKPEPVKPEPKAVAKPKAEPAPAPAPAKAAPAESWEDDEAAPKAPEKKPEPVAKPAPKPDPKPEPKAEPKAEEPDEDEDVGKKKKANVDEDLKDPDPRPHFNVVFIGHVDAGKSTTCGNVLLLAGMVDQRQIEKYQREAKEKAGESWYLAYVLDSSEEEKAKGKTVEVGRAPFETPNRRFTILDAPGHKAYVPNMISGASQADIGILIISARKGEFETGFEKGGQTREHAILCRTLGVDKLFVAVNKMDDPSVQWSEERYTTIVDKLTPFLSSAECKFKPEEVEFFPISGLTGDNLKERCNTPSWWKGPTLWSLLDNLPVRDRDSSKGLRMPLLDGYKDMGDVVAAGKVEQGKVEPGMKAVILPSNDKVTVKGVYIAGEKVTYAGVGENVTCVLGGISEDAIRKGFVLCPAVKDAGRCVTKFKAQMQVLELLEERPIISSGYQAILHVHTAIEECTIAKLVEEVVMKPKPKKVAKPKFVRANAIVTVIIEVKRSVCVETFANTSQLGRFTLRDELKTIALGRIIELPKE